MNLFRIQKIIALAITTLALYGLASQIARITGNRPFSVRWITMNSISAIYGIISYKIDSKAIRYSQGLLFLLIAQLVISQSIIAFTGIWLLITGTILLFKYQFFYSRYMVALTLFLNLGLISHSAVQNDQLSRLPGLTLMIFFSFVVFYLIFEEPHQQAIQEIRYLEPLSKIGRNGTAIVHSVKNKLSNLDTCVNFLRYDLLPNNEIIEKFDSSLMDMRETVNGLLAISNSGHESHDEVLSHNLSEMLSGLYTLLRQDRMLQQYADLEAKIQPNIHATFNKFSFILAFENIIQNALEAIQLGSHKGMIEIYLNENSLEVRNNGGMIPTCKDCVKDCNNCPRYSKIGTTTKKYGTGNGLPQVIDMANQAGWSLKLRAYDGDMTSVLFVIA